MNKSTCPNLALLLALLFSLSAPVLAQQQEQSGMIAAQAATPEQDAAAAAAQAAQLELLENQIPASLFFNSREIDIIRSAIQGVISSLPVETPEEGEDGLPVTPTIPKRHLIKLAGVVYQSPKKWTIWINGARVTPERLLPEIQGIRVEEKSVRLLWKDERNNQVISITLRPHQTYDVDNGILLPGSPG